MMTPDELLKLNIGTRVIRAAALESPIVRTHIPPIYQTVNFDYESVDDGLAIFHGEKSGYSYTREGNPTSDLFARLVAILEEGETAIAVASGMAAISSAVLSQVKPGDNIVSSAAIYGGTKGWFDQLAALDIPTRFVDITNYEQIRRTCDERTKILYTEVLSSPNLVIADIKRLAEFARTRDMKLIVDSTFTPPPIIQPLKMGAHIVIHSATKYINGHGDAIGGVVISDATTIDQIQQVVRLYGHTISPFNAWLCIRGLKTLQLRLERHCANAMTIAEFLRGHEKVKNVSYPGLAAHPQHDLARTQLQGFGGMLSFEVGDVRAGKRVMDSVRVCNFTTSLGEIDTLIMHPASSSHVGLSTEERMAAGVTDGLLRLSVGIEDVNDLIRDLDQALDKI